MNLRLLLLSFLISFGIHAQVGGDLDVTFGTDGIAEYTIDVDGILRGVTVYDTHRLPDGRLLAVGWAQSGCSGSSTFYGVILRLNSDGSLDTTFQEGGYGFYGNSGFEFIYPESANSFYIVGNERIRKMDVDGNVDTTYGVDGTVMTVMELNDMILLSDGRLIFGGYTMNSAGKRELTVSRRLQDGSLDTTFATDGYFKMPYVELAAISLFDITLDSSGGILINGRKQRDQNNGNIMLAHLTSEGVLDTTFADNGIFVDLFHYDARAQEIHIEDDGKVLVIGSGKLSSFGTRGMLLSRLNTNGTLDTSYATDGRAHHPIYSNSGVDRIHPFENGYVISGDSFNTMYIVKIDANGNLDTSFDDDGFVLLDTFDNFDESGFATDSNIEGNRMIIAANEYFAHCAQSKRKAHFVRVFLNNDGLVVTAFPAEDMELCDTNNDGIELFDLTTNSPAIIGGQTNVTLTYHETQGDADTGNAAIADPTAYFNTNTPQSIFARVEDDTNGDFDTTTFNLILNPTPTPFTDASLEVCDDDNDGFAQFTLNDADVIIANGEPNLVISYHGSQADAEQNILALTNPYNNDTASIDLVWARVEAINTGCFTVVELDLFVLDAPIVPTDVDDILQCGNEVFDLTTRSAEIFGTQSTTDFTLQFYQSLNDASNATNPIVDPTAHVIQSNPQPIYARLENNISGCFNIAEFNLISGNSVIFTAPNDLFVSDGTLDGFAEFDLMVNTSVVLDGQSATDFDVSYFESEADAVVNTNAIATPEAYTNLTNPQIIFVRKTEINTDCFDVDGFEIETDESLNVNDNFTTGLKMFPNPAENLVQLVSSEFSSEVNIELYSLDGKQILSVSRQPINGSLRLNISEVATGSYFLKITSEGNTAIKHLLKK